MARVICSNTVVIHCSIVEDNLLTHGAVRIDTQCISWQSVADCKVDGAALDLIYCDPFRYETLGLVRDLELPERSPVGGRRKFG